MAIAHAASGDLIHAQPLGARLSEVQSHALLKSHQLELIPSGVACRQGA